jgi:hypothetical protein
VIERDRSSFRGRRAWLGGLVAAGALGWSGVAAAGSYLERAALLLDGARRDTAALRRRITDKELARVVRRVAEARSDAASTMEIPAAVGKAHPHLLLALAAVERAAQAVLEGNVEATFERLEAVRREDSIFRAAIREAGFEVPPAPADEPRARRAQ